MDFHTNDPPTAFMVQGLMQLSLGDLLCPSLQRLELPPQFRFRIGLTRSLMSSFSPCFSLEHALWGAGIRIGSGPVGSSSQGCFYHDRC